MEDGAMSSMEDGAMIWMESVLISVDGHDLFRLEAVRGFRASPSGAREVEGVKFPGLRARGRAHRRIADAKSKGARKYAPVHQEIAKCANYAK